MMKRVELYEEATLQTERGRKNRLLIVMLVIAAVGLAACIVLCTLATRRNLRILMPITIAVSVLAGWVNITILHGPFAAINARVRHYKTMLNEPRETEHGSFEKLDGVTLMKNGMTIRKVRRTENGHETILSVNEALSKQLPDAFTGSVETVYAFIAAYEVDEDD